MLIDQAMPAWQWREYYQHFIPADPETVWNACLSAKTGDLRLTRPLMILRGLGGGMAKDGVFLDAIPPRRIAVSTGREILPGLIFPTRGKLRDIVQPDSIAALTAAQGPSLVRQAVDMRLQAIPGGTLLVNRDPRHRQ